MYPNFMLWAPVTYDADARHVFGLSQSCAQFAERYVRFGMPPFERAASSVTRARPRVALPGCSNGPHAARYVPRPASSSRRFVTGDDHVNWLFFTERVQVAGGFGRRRRRQSRRGRCAPTTAFDVGLRAAAVAGRW